MTNINFFLASFLLVWLLMVGYLGYLHLKISRLYEILGERKQDQDDTS